MLPPLRALLPLPPAAYYDKRCYLLVRRHMLIAADADTLMLPFSRLSRYAATIFAA